MLHGRVRAGPAAAGKGPQIAATGASAELGTRVALSPGVTNRALAYRPLPERLPARTPPLALLSLAAAVALGGCGDPPPAPPRVPVPLPALLAPPGVTEIVGLTAAPRVATGLVDDRGRPVTLACSSCHSVKAPDRETRSGAALDQFHQGLTFDHGGQTCLSCHDGRDYDRLRLADQTAVPFTEAMTLCRQCHGPQGRDYDHGAHGGMTGAWDLSRGGRVRNTCTVCHDPHAPKIPRVTPAPGPTDRAPSAPARPRGEH